MNSSVRYVDGLSERLSSYPDANNNAKSLYSLRPRSLRRAVADDDGQTQPIRATSKARCSKPKQKPAPLSKYRRKTANARERSRMREINAAFEALRRAVPHLQCPGFPAPASASANEKLTKITTLRLAMKYIATLSSVLKDPASNGTGYGFSSGSELGDLISDCSDLDCLFLESDGESMHLHSDLSHRSLTPDLSDQCLTPVDLAAGFTPEFSEPSLSPTFADQTLSPFDALFPDFS